MAIPTSNSHQGRPRVGRRRNRKAGPHGLPLKGLENSERAGRPQAAIDAALKRPPRIPQRSASEGHLEIALSASPGIETEKLATEYGELSNTSSALRRDSGHASSSQVLVRS